MEIKKSETIMVKGWRLRVNSFDFEITQKGTELSVWVYKGNYKCLVKVIGWDNSTPLEELCRRILDSDSIKDSIPKEHLKTHRKHCGVCNSEHTGNRCFKCWKEETL